MQEASAKSGDWEKGDGPALSLRGGTAEAINIGIKRLFARAVAGAEERETGVSAV